MGPIPSVSMDERRAMTWMRQAITGQAQEYEQDFVHIVVSRKTIDITGTSSAIRNLHCGNTLCTPYALDRGHGVNHEPDWCVTQHGAKRAFHNIH